MPDIFVSKKKDMPTETKTKPTKVELANKHSLPGKTNSPLSAFCFYPDGVKFETKDEKEETILLLRQHPIVNLKWILITALMLLVPSIVKAIGFFEILPSGFEFIITLVWYLITMAYALEGFLNWFFNVYIVTNMRIIDIDFNNMIYKQVSSAEIDNIQDITYSMGGVIRTLFDYGNVTIQTAAEVSQFEFLAVPHPSRVVDIMDDMIGNHGDKAKL